MTKTILITGASKGIGLCCALGLKARGYTVFASARQPADIAMLEQQGLHAITLDLLNNHSIHAAIAEVLNQTGGTLDALFNNAGFGQPGAVEDLTQESIRTQFEANVFGPLELINQIIPVMRQQGHGRIINMGSILGIVSLSYRGAYNASKYALEGLTDTLRLELHGTNIHVSLIEPGPIRSNFRNSSYTYLKNINISKSAHKPIYEAISRQFNPDKPSDWFNNNRLESFFIKPPEAVLAKLIHALESKHPKIRYYVTIPAYLLATLKRILPASLLDKILLGSSFNATSK